MARLARWCTGTGRTPLFELVQHLDKRFRFLTQEAFMIALAREVMNETWCNHTSTCCQEAPNEGSNKGRDCFREFSQDRRPIHCAHLL
jgi:hypothetical protein